MGKLIDYVNRLYKSLERQKELLSETDNEYEKVKIEFEISSLEEEIQNTIDVFENTIENDIIIEFIKKELPEKLFEKTMDAYNSRVERSKKFYIDNNKGIISNAKIKLQQLAYNSPNYKNEDDPKHEYYLQTMEEMEKAQAALDNPQYIKISIFSVIDKFFVESIIKYMAEKAEKLSNVEEVLGKLESFLPKEKSNVGVTYPVKEALNKITKDINTSNEVKEFIFENENLINEITALDSPDSTKKLYAHLQKIETIVEAKGKKIFAEGAKENGLDDIAASDDTSFVKMNTQKELDRIYRDDFKLEYSENTKLLYTTLLREMEFRNMIPEGITLEEKGIKAYGFTKFAIARNRFIEAAVAEDFDEDEFLETWNELYDEVKNIESMNKIIDTKLGTSYDSMPTNVDTYRSAFIPRRFKQNEAHNAQLSGLYITLSFIKSHNLTIDEFMNDPTNAIKKAFIEDANKLKADYALKDKSKAESLFTLADTQYKSEIDVYGYVRTIEFINGIETDPEIKRKNLLVTAGMLNAFGKHKRAVESAQLLLSNGNVKETLQNILLAERDDEGKFPYIDCYSEAIVGVGKVAKEGDEYKEGIEDPNKGFIIQDKPTSLDKVANLFLFEEKFADMMQTIKEYKNAIKNPDNAGKRTRIGIKELVVAAQELTAKYLLTHDIKEMNKMYDNVVSEHFLTEMNNFIKDPSLEPMLNGVEVSDMGNPQLETILKNKNKLFANKEKSVAKYVKENVKRQDEAYIRKIKEITNIMDQLDKQVEEISKNMGKDLKGQTNDEIEAIGMRQRELMNQLLSAQDERIEELRKDYEKGKITKYFFEKRAEQLSTGKIKDLKNMPSLFKVDEPKYKNYKSFKKDYMSKLTIDERNSKNEEDLQKEYKEFMYNARIEKLNYLSDHVLSDHGIKASRSLNSSNEFTAKSTKLEINKKVYEEEYKQLNDNNQKALITRQNIIVEAASNESLITGAKNTEQIVEQKVVEKNKFEEVLK